MIEGITREEIVQQKNKYGYARAKARKIGRWNPHEEKFEPATWLPQINAPVLLVASEEMAPTAEAVGHFPGTAYMVGIDISEAVTHNTAILGILGIGKSFLAIELVERMIAAGVKVICLDLTNQYVEQLSEFRDPGYETQNGMNCTQLVVEEYHIKTGRRAVPKRPSRLRFLSSCANFWTQIVTDIFAFITPPSSTSGGR